MQSIPPKKRGDYSDSGAISKDYSLIRARTCTKDKDREPLLMLQEEKERLEKELLEKDVLLNSMENSLNQRTALQMKLDELKCHADEKDSLMKSIHLQLCDAKVCICVLVEMLLCLGFS